MKSFERHCIPPSSTKIQTDNTFCIYAALFGSDLAFQPFFCLGCCCTYNTASRLPGTASGLTPTAFDLNSVTRGLSPAAQLHIAHSS